MMDSPATVQIIRDLVKSLDEEQDAAHGEYCGCASRGSSTCSEIPDEAKARAKAYLAEADRE